jgi:Protein of unknown function (DUF2752)
VSVGAIDGARSRWIGVRAASSRERVVAVALLVAGAAALAAVGLVDPRASSIFPPCPTARWLGVQCPGCGSTRAMHDLLNADPVRAFRCNPALVVIGLPVLAAVGGALLLCATTGRRVVVRLPPRIEVAVLVLILLYTGVRNIPGRAFDALRPPDETRAPTQ